MNSIPEIRSFDFHICALSSVPSHASPWNSVGFPGELHNHADYWKEETFSEFLSFLLFSPLLPFLSDKGPKAFAWQLSLKISWIFYWLHPVFLFNSLAQSVVNAVDLLSLPRGEASWWLIIGHQMNPFYASQGQSCGETDSNVVHFVQLVKLQVAFNNCCPFS